MPVPDEEDEMVVGCECGGVGLPSVEKAVVVAVEDVAVAEEEEVPDIEDGAAGGEVGLGDVLRGG